MGKSNRIRAKQANEKAAVKALGTKKKSQGMPSWLMTLITLVITFAFLFSIVFSLLTANGVFPVELLHNFIKSKREECRQMAAIPHPAEFDKYYNL